MKYTTKPKTANPVAKHAGSTTTSSAGAHYQGKDQKKKAKHGEVKHKNKAMDLAEGFDNPEYDDEAGMADNNLETLKRAVQGLDDLIQSGDNLPEWCQEKIAVAKNTLVNVWDYMKSEKDSMIQINEYETHTYKDSQGNVWRVDDEGNKELVQAAPGSGYGGGYSGRYKRPLPRYRPQLSKGMYFYNVKPGQENDAMKAGLKQTKSGKWFSTYSNPSADKMFGPGKYWEPKSEGVAEGSNPTHYADQLAMKVFQQNPNLSTSGRADELLDIGFAIAKQELGKSAMGIFRDEDFPSDFVSAYGHLKRNASVSENPQHSHQYKTTMKHADRPTVQQRMAAHDIKPGIAGYRDRIDLLKDLERTGKLKNMDEEQGYDEISPKSASYILRKLDQGVSMSEILDDFPELSRMMEIIAGEYGLHLDDDFEEIEDILMNDLEELADQHDKGYDDSDSSLSEEKQKGVDGKACWKGYKRMGTKKKGGRTVDNCVKMESTDWYTFRLHTLLNDKIKK